MVKSKHVWFGVALVSSLLYALFWTNLGGERKPEVRPERHELSLPAEPSPLPAPPSRPSSVWAGQEGQPSQADQALHKRLQALEQRIRSIEEAGDEADTRFDQSANAGKPKRVSELQLGDWMQEVIRYDEWDGEYTEQVSVALSAALSNSVGTEAEEVECGQRFCRVALMRADGEKPDIRRLFGKEPFGGTGFTVPRADGQMDVFFPRPGIELQDVRREALQKLGEK